MGDSKQAKRDRYYLSLALKVASASKCVRAQYGTVIVARNGHVLGQGYNGKPKGACNDDVCYREGLPPSAPKNNCCLHSEVNALLFAGSPQDREGATMYVSGVPCRDCALVIMQSGVSRLVYLLDERGHHYAQDDFWEQYGFASCIERVAFTTAELA